MILYATNFKKAGLCLKKDFLNFVFNDKTQFRKKKGLHHVPCFVSLRNLRRSPDPFKIPEDSSQRLQVFILLLQLCLLLLITWLLLCFFFLLFLLL